MSRRKPTDSNERRILADQGDANACFEIAESYYVQKNYAEAFKWYNKTISCKNPNPVAYFNIAYAYQFGEGTAVDIAASLDFYQKAAAYELPQALYNLAFFYQNGIIVPRDKEKAVRLCREATLKLNELQNRLYKLQCEHEKLSNNYYACIKLIDDSNNRVKALENKNKQLDQDKNKFAEKCLEFNKNFENAEARRKVLEQRFDIASEEIKKLNNTIKKTEDVVLQNETLIRSLNQEIANLRANRDEISQKYFELNRLVETIRSENNILKRNIKTNEEEYKKLWKRVANIERQNENKDKEIQAASRKIMDLCSEKDELTEKYYQLSDTLKIEQSSKEEMEKSVSELTAEKNRLEATIAKNNSDSRQQKERLEAEIANLSQLKQRVMIIAGILGGAFGVSLAALILSLFS